MSSNSVRLILERKLESLWAGRTPIYWDDSNDKPIPGEAYIRATLHGVDSEQMSISCRKDFDLFVIQVFTPKGEGSGDNFTLCDALTAGFYGYAEENLTCTKVLNERVGKAQEWYQRNVLIETEYYSNKL